MITVASRGRWLIARFRSRLPHIGRPEGEAGSAMIEFVFLAVLLLVPLFYLVMVLARLQAGAYAVSAASREAGRAYVTAEVAEQAYPRALSAAGLAFSDQGFELDGERSIEIRCDSRPCPRPQGRVQVTATVSVPLPMVPAFFSGIVPTQIPVSATHVATVDRFGGQ